MDLRGKGGFLDGSLARPGKMSKFVFTNPQVRCIHMHCQLLKFQLNTAHQSPGDKPAVPEKWRLGQLPNSTEQGLCFSMKCFRCMFLASNFPC